MQVNSSSPLALAHNDDAVLERHHAHETSIILANPKTSILEGLSKPDALIVRKQVCWMVLVPLVFLCVCPDCGSCG